MGGFVTLLMAVFFLWLGVTCLHRPQRVQQWLISFYKQNKPDGAVPGWLQGNGIILFTRLFGVLCMVNFFLQVYLLLQPAPVTSPGLESAP